MAHKNSKQLKDGDKEYKEQLELRKREFEAKDKEIAEKDKEYDLMERDKDVEEINEKANSFTMKNRPRMNKITQNPQQQLNKNQAGSDTTAMFMQNTA